MANQQNHTIAILLQQSLSRHVNSFDVGEFLPSQVLCIINQVTFTETVEKLMSERELGKLRAGLMNAQNLSSLVGSGDLQLSRLKLKAIILNMIHQRDVLDELSEDGCRNILDWV